MDVGYFSLAISGRGRMSTFSLQSPPISEVSLDLVSTMPKLESP